MTTETTAPSRRRQQHLLLDADDTLWENNVYFERAIAEFLDFLGHSSMSREDVRAVLDEIERANAQVHGYGSAAFSRNLTETYRRLAEREIGDNDLAIVMNFGERVQGQPMELIDGVEETLIELSTRHQLVLVTKGEAEEQRLKIDRSGLAHHFAHARIVSEKHPGVYEDIVADLSLDAEKTWMIGNSPKSDINASLAAGLNAVFIPHEMTWSLEHAEIEHQDGRLLVLTRFTELVHHF
ncbi:MAG: HAD family hydrolase [Thermomicrobiales bacterium]